MRWRRITFWFSLSVLALLVLALTWLWTADLGVLKPQVERIVSEQTGRDFSINGDFIVDFNRHPTVIAEDVRFANPDWAEEPHMVTVGRAEIRIDLWSLVSGPFIIEFVDIDDVGVQLLNPKSSEPNWVLVDDDQDVAEEEEDTDSPGIDLLVEELYVDNVGIVIDSAERTRPLNLQVNSLRQTSRDDGMLELDLDGLLDGSIVQVKGETGTWDALLAGKDVRFDIEAVLDTFSFTASGLIDDLVSPRQPQISFTATSPDIDDLTTLLGLGDEGSGDIDLSGSTSKTAEDELLLELIGNVGATQIQTRGTLTDLQNPRDIDFDITASGPDLGRILRLAGIHQVRESPFMIRIDAATEGQAFAIKEGKMVFAQSQIDISGRMPNFPSVDDAVIRLTIEGPDLGRFRYVTGLPGAAEGPFSLAFTVDVNDDGVELLNLDVRTELGELTGDGKLGELPDFFGSEFEVRASTRSLERLAGAYGIEDMPDYPIEFSGKAQYLEEGVRILSPLIARLADVTVTASGLVSPVRGALGSELEFTIDGPDLSGLVNAFADVDSLPAQPYELQGRLQIRDDGYRFRGVEGNVGTSAIAVDGLLSTQPGLAGTRFAFSSEGPAFEELAEATALEVQGGPYELSGNVALQPNLVTLDDIELDRDNGKVSANVDIGLPASELQIKYDVQADGPDIRAIVAEVGPLQFLELPFSIDARGEVNEAYVRFEEFDVAVGDATTRSQGEIEFGEGGGASNLHWSGNVPSMKRLFTSDGLLLRDQAVSWSADLSGRGGELRADNLLARIGDSDVHGKIYFKAGDVPELLVDVESDAIIFVPLREEPEYKYEAEPKFEDGRLIPDIAIPFDAMKRLNASLDIDIGELQRDALLMKDIEFDAELRDGVLDISRASFKARAGALTARARLEPTDGSSGTAKVELIARQFALGMTEMNQDLLMIGDIDINLEATGADLRSMLATSNGEFFINSRGGRFTNNRLIQAIYGDLLQEIVTTINPFRETDPYTDFNCIVVPLKFDDGVVTSAPSIFMNTTKVRMLATSSIDLETEELELGVRTTPERRLSVSAGELLNPYVQVVGTLAAPRLAVDEAGLLITGGAAVATGGLTILARGVWDRVARSKNPCNRFGEQAIEELGDRFPDLAIEGFGRIQ